MFLKQDLNIDGSLLLILLLILLLDLLGNIGSDIQKLS
jgi:hypothetical protein